MAMIVSSEVKRHSSLPNEHIPVLPRSGTKSVWYLLLAFTLTVWLVFRVVYLVWFCPFDLAPDEAHYWDWSRQLDWCYYSKGPLIAWLIRAAEASCGSWLRDQQGTTMPAVRLPAVLCGVLFALGVFTLTYQLTSSARLAYLTMLVIMLTPHFTALSTLITIDAPFLCLWQWSLIVALHALNLHAQHPQDQSRNEPNSSHANSTWRRWLSWLMLGLLVGLGILAKPTMVLFPACLLLFLICHRSSRRLFHSAPFWLMLTVAAGIGGGPILWWNYHHDWVTFRHILTQATLTTANRWRPWGALEYMGVQAALLLVSGFILWCLSTVWALRTKRYANSPLPQPIATWLLCFSWPVFLFFVPFSFRTNIQPNWPVAAYLAAIPLVALWLHHHLAQPVGNQAHATPDRYAFFGTLGPSLERAAQPEKPWPRRFACLVRTALAASVILALTITVFLHQPRWAYESGMLPTLARLLNHANQPYWPRRFDPTCRLQGWRELAIAVQQLRQTCQAQGIELALAATPYGTAAELAFYLPDQPRVFCLNRPNGLRFSQYDLYRPNPVTDPDYFRGQTFLCIGPMTETAQAGFRLVKLMGTISIRRYGHEIARERIYLGIDFHGFPSESYIPKY